jgi:MEMO1 family protein
MQTDPSAGTRPSPIAGQWYEGQANRLAAAVDSYLSQAQIAPIKGQPLAVISPHAGHIYSGGVAGHAFAAVRNLRPEVVAVVSPLHQYARGAIYTSAHSAYWTPLGEIPVDAALVEQFGGHLKSTTGVSVQAALNDHEHSLEIELPFLQRIYTHSFRLVPLMVRELDLDFLRAVGQALHLTLPETNPLVVASTDLSHFYSRDEARILDGRMLDAMQSLDEERVISLETGEQGFACGAGAVASVITWAKLAGAASGQILKYATSGDVTGDYSSVVGYGAVLITK